MKENMYELSMISIFFFLHYRCVFPPFTVSSKHPLLFLTKLNIWYEKSVIFKRKIIILSLAGLFMIFVFCLVCMLLTSTLYFILCVQSEYVIWNHIYFFKSLCKKNNLFFFGDIPHFIFMFHTKFRLWKFGYKRRKGGAIKKLQAKGEIINWKAP